jgi:hypothetical protein
MSDVLQDNKAAKTREVVQRAIQLAEEAQQTVDELVTLLRQYGERQEDTYE